MDQCPELSSPTSESQAWHPARAPRPCQPHGSECGGLHHEVSLWGSTTAVQLEQAELGALCLGGCLPQQWLKEQASTCAARTLNVYIEVFSGFSHGFGTDGLKNTLLAQGCMLATAPKPEGLQATGRRDHPGWPPSRDSCHKPCCCRRGIWLPLPLCSEFSVKFSLCADEIHATWAAQSNRALKCWGWDTNPANLAPRSVLPHPAQVSGPSFRGVRGQHVTRPPIFLKTITNLILCL